MDGVLEIGFPVVIVFFFCFGEIQSHLIHFHDLLFGRPGIDFIFCRQHGIKDMLHFRGNLNRFQIIEEGFPAIHNLYAPVDIHERLLKAPEYPA